jgi:hypothetical protein
LHDDFALFSKNENQLVGAQDPYKPCTGHLVSCSTLVPALEIFFFSKIENESSSSSALSKYLNSAEMRH